MDVSNISIWYWILLLIVGVVCMIIGYFWGKRSVDTSELEARVASLEGANTHLKTDLEACNEQLAEASAHAAEPIPFDAEAARAAFGKRIKENDLKLVEGIGPKIESLFHNFDIKTWQALSDVSVAKCQEVLDSGGDRFKVHDPASWPMQARMAYEGRWKDLARWQDEHNHGKL